MILVGAKRMTMTNASCSPMPPDSSLYVHNVSDDDWHKIKVLFVRQLQWVTTKMQEHIQEVYAMLEAEPKKVRERYKEYDYYYLGHYAH